MTWRYVLYGVVALALLVVAGALLFGKRYLADRPHQKPEPALIAAHRRARDASDPPEALHFRAFAETVPNIRLNAIAEQAADANAHLAAETQQGDADA